MKTALLLSLSLVASSSAFAQFPFDKQLHRVTPDRGPVAGGTIAKIEGVLDFEGTADPCAGPRVYVGGAPAEVRSSSATTIEFVTPPYTAGTFDVSVEKCGSRGAIKNAFTYVRTDDVAWERVLLPVFLTSDVPGAHGSLWRTELKAYNNASGAIVTSRPDVECPSNDVACRGAVAEGRFTANVTTDQHQPGRLLYISNPYGAKRVHFNLRVRDVSRESSSLGSELRPVFEDDAYGPYDSFVLLNIPLGTIYRQKLRIYRLDLGTPATVNVFFDDAGTYLGTAAVTLSSEPSNGDFLLYPAYAEVNLDQLPQVAGHSHMDLLISVPAGRYWAFVSVTNNDTQQVTHITP